MSGEVLLCMFVPFIGTSLGSTFVFFLKNKLSDSMNRIFSGFAAGIMTAAAVFSLLIPAIENSIEFGKMAFLPSVIGFWIGTAILIIFDSVLTKITRNKDAKTQNCHNMSFFAVTLHNIPEGMAVGMVCAAAIFQPGKVISSSVIALCVGVAIQNIPEGAIISMPFYSHGKSKSESFLLGVISGAVEPIGAFIAFIAASFVSSFMPLLLSMAAGAMFYVTADRLIYEMKGDGKSKKGIISFTLGFTVMMALDIALG